MACAFTVGAAATVAEFGCGSVTTFGGLPNRQPWVL
jgi:hypothetical protein